MENMHANIHKSKKTLKIIFVSSDKYPPYRPAAKAIFAEELVKRGHVIDFILQSSESCNKAYKIPLGLGNINIGPTEERNSKLNRFKKHILDISNDLYMFKLVIKSHYDIIQVKDKYVSALFAILAAKIGKAKFCYWLAFPHPEASLYRSAEGIARYKFYYRLRGLFLKLILYNIILPTADHIFVQSDQMKKDISREGICEEKMTPIYGSVNLNNIPYKNKPYNLSVTQSQNTKEKKIVYLGTLIRMRKLNFLIRVHSKVVEQFPNTKLYFLGKGDMPEDEEFLREEATRMNLTHAVIFTGYIPMQIAWEYIRNADVCLSPFYPIPILNSTSPTKLIEYMAMGKPVVANDHPEQRLVISESGAGICVPWEEDSFAQSIIMILSNPDLGLKMGLKGRQYVEKFRTNKILADKVEMQYIKLLNTKKGPKKAKKLFLTPFSDCQQMDRDKLKNYNSSYE